MTGTLLTDEDNKLSILIVDDAPANIQILANILKDQYRIRVATSGQQCLDQAQSQDKPDLILLDIMMPEMDGFEVCKRLKKTPDTESIPVIFVTGRQETHDEQKGFELGAVDYTLKPVKPVIVLARIKLHCTLIQQQRALMKLALHDQLTGLYNRHFLDEIADQKIASAHRHQYNLSILMVDIDHFKKINDTHGHPMGDAVLKKLGQLLGHKHRKEDIVSVRFGGEEFVIMLDQCNQAQATICAEKIRKNIEALHPEGLAITTSIGVAQLLPNERFPELIKRADEAVYKAKDNGRNCVVSV